MNTTVHPGIIETVKDKTVAATEGTGHVVEKVVDTTVQVITTTVKDAAQVGGTVGTAATGLVKEVIKDTKEVVVGAEHAVGAVAGGAVNAVGEVGASTVDAVRKTVHGDKTGPKESEPTATKN